MIKRFALLVLSLAGLAAFVWVAQPVLPAYAATPQSEICEGIGAASGAGDCQSDISLTAVIRNILKIFSVIVGIVAVIMIIVGGFRYVTAGGDSNSVSSAKNTIIYALIGLGVAALSQSIVWFVLDNIQ